MMANHCCSHMKGDVFSPGVLPITLFRPPRIGRRMRHGNLFLDADTPKGESEIINGLRVEG